ncbi:LysE family translocator [Ramlibacter sp. H39-3-26]|uniref:LysE family translocator n=1 Tax=Curvibacter soli TaxID=3031331 RepID=UPI0023DAAAB6|nr:LysE family translocator [Ramlibacter sp. H39-3-26]MDF1486346.1 LysE family translocator [Ramlibacter sp. H39-3-26]
MGIEHIGVFIAAGLLLNLVPGPDALYIVGHALRGGLRAGIVAGLGIAAGCLVHVLATALGVSALLAASATAFAALKWLGAAYLAWMGLRLLWGSRPGAVPRGAPDLVAGSAGGISAGGQKGIFFGGFCTNVLNPKVALFFLAFVPQFIAPGAPHKPLAFMLLGLLFIADSVPVGIGWALLAAALARRVGAMRRGLRWLDRAAGVLFIGLGVRLALADNPAS